VILTILTAFAVLCCFGSVFINGVLAAEATTWYEFTGRALIALFWYLWGSLLIADELRRRERVA
jgi:hypothetical protein